MDRWVESSGYLDMFQLLKDLHNLCLTPVTFTRCLKTLKARTCVPWMLFADLVSHFYMQYEVKQIKTHIRLMLATSIYAHWSLDCEFE
jgi:hypothetical protein